ASVLPSGEKATVSAGGPTPEGAITPHHTLPGRALRSGTLAAARGGVYFRRSRPEASSHTATPSSPRATATGRPSGGETPLAAGAVPLGRDSSLSRVPTATSHTRSFSSMSRAARRRLSAENTSVPQIARPGSTTIGMEAGGSILPTSSPPGGPSEVRSVPV